jgi:peptidoglycan/LPS O-acetylase OafA/YrhL
VKFCLPLKWVLVLGTIAAFGLGYWLSGERPSVAYYLLPVRAWELSLGASFTVLLALFRCRNHDGRVPGATC